MLFKIPSQISTRFVTDFVFAKVYIVYKVVITNTTEVLRFKIFISC